MARRSSNQKVIPESARALETMKYEIAAELGLTSSVPAGGDSEFAGELGAGGMSAGAGAVYWPQLATRDAGAVGGMMTRRLIEQAEAVLRELR